MYKLNFKDLIFKLKTGSNFYICNNFVQIKHNGERLGIVLGFKDEFHDLKKIAHPILTPNNYLQNCILIFHQNMKVDMQFSWSIDELYSDFF